MVAWLMRRYQLRCCNFLVSTTGQYQKIFVNRMRFLKYLIPSMDENRRLWQLDAGMQEDKRWRPGEALAWFVRTHCVPA